ncbi:MAG TPA: FAA hydrolase family protein [Acinetobacter ursingii]|uniref:FAA hydrolase family protein n=1 Tax=Acinetobacter ursingii TaxID=108980 RepID=A0A3D2SHQ5_9GAMM|nr:fumarylacetoacetate hydrolase family protein [Acinetobacter ursingii]MCH2004707.1 fumarylacetoacetate hydrolase family protein [Acinetobacter ursingii]MCU4304218.1 fumarylacetoacetate hydrolase family protein [Acinetobacter ursingii]MCU4358947.1 fumarylacetoacetate hydrolase family protein [Acinetobacter ursingii]MCU4370223.1 fumarylacetoacetate hydrolase family protein [Acinetobacter ursingii]MCU4380527.1 fumarylacetoacetate hydrolase family protein [Acinetobacter ursingii]
MRFLSYMQAGKKGLAIRVGDQLKGLTEVEENYPGHLEQLLQQGGDALINAAQVLKQGNAINLDQVEQLPPLSQPPKIICVGLNYADHTKESPYEQPDYPTLFSRFNSSLIANGQPIKRPLCSEQLDYEGELVAIIGKRGRHIAKEDALDYVAGYSIFNDASIRDYQFKAPQWTVGKNFDDTGAFGPEFVTADELPEGAKGLLLTTRLNGKVVQQANTSDMLFDIETLISTISEAITLEPGDLIVSGTPAGVGLGHKPPLWMKQGDVCEVEIEKIGILRSPIANESK